MVDLHRLQSLFMLDQINVKIAEFQQFLLRGGLDFSGIIRKTPLENDVRNLDTKFGWPTMTAK